MSNEDLDQELAEVFECGLFIFPIYDHRSARIIIQHLISRGICVEEIAEALEDSENDIEMWLNRGGKHMVGEWVMAWVNEARSDYKHERAAYKKALKERLLKGPSSSRSLISTESEDSATDQAEISDVGSPTDLMSFLQSELSYNKPTNLVQKEMNNNDVAISNLSIEDSNSTTTKSLSSEETPPPLPPYRHIERSMSFLNDLNQIYDVVKFKSGDSDSEKEKNSTNVSIQNDYESIGNQDDLEEGIYMTIPEVRSLNSKDNDYMNSNQSNLNDEKTKKTEPIYSKYKRRYSFIVDKSGLPVCPNCTCKLAYYSYKKHTLHVNDEKKHKDSNDNYFKYITSEIASKAHDIIADSLKKVGPGFIFVMTDCLTECLPWSLDCRYNIASSRLPERWLMEFRSNSIEVEIIWKVHVENHMKAMREVHSMLIKYRIENDWYKCPLSVIVTAVSKVAKRYNKEGV